jgi:hypothetical protein
MCPATYLKSWLVIANFSHSRSPDAAMTCNPTQGLSNLVLLMVPIVLPKHVVGLEQWVRRSLWHPSSHLLVAASS